MTISVVVPAYNEQDLLPSCLEALFAQTRPPDEIIVIDNNSTDNTAETARTYGVIVMSESVQGIMPAVYTGMNSSRGDIIARCDADSIVPSDWLERIEQKMTANPKAAGITGPGEFYGIDRLRGALAQIWYMYAYFLLVGSALANWPLFGSNCALRRSVWDELSDKLHKDSDHIHDDMEISSHILPTQPIIFMPSLVVKISARALRSADMRRRYTAGWNTLALHWPTNYPWRRWQARLTRP